MPALIISPEAEQDLLDIWLHIAEDSLINADRFLDQLYEKLIKLSEFPEMGIARPDLIKNLRSFPASHYLFFYRITADGIELIRALHGSRDINSVF